MGSRLLTVLSGGHTNQYCCQVLKYFLMTKLSLCENMSEIQPPYFPPPFLPTSVPNVPQQPDLYQPFVSDAYQHHFQQNNIHSSYGRDYHGRLPLESKTFSSNKIFIWEKKRTMETT